VLPKPERKPNGYRLYKEADVECVRFVAGARSLGFSLNDIVEIMGPRDRREIPWRVVLDLLEQKARRTPGGSRLYGSWKRICDSCTG